jgi:hypothetical protein
VRRNQTSSGDTSYGYNVLTTEALVTDIPEEKGAAPQMPGGGMGWTTKVHAG